MVKIDFTDWQSFSACPGWWRNFVKVTCAGLSSVGQDSHLRDKALSIGLEAHKAKIVPVESYDQEIDYIEFETEEDYLIFVIKWS